MGFEACHPAVNFIFFAAVLYGSATFRHPVFLAIAYLCAFAYSVKRRGKRAAIFNLCLLPLVAAFALYYSSYHHFGVTVLRKNFVDNNMTLESLVYGAVLGLGGVPVRENQPVAVPVFDHLAAPDSQNRSGGKAHQPGAKRHWQRQQPGNCFSAVCQLPANLLHAHYLDDFGPGSGVRLHALPWKSATGPDSLLYLPL